MKNKGGRPKNSFKDAKKEFPEEWYNILLKEYKEGASDVEIKALIWSWRGSFSNDLWDRWLVDEEEFSETIKMGRALSHAWWLKKGRKSLDDKDFSYTGWYMNMKNRFKWSDKQEVKAEVENTNTNVEIDYSKLDESTLKDIISKLRPEKGTK